MKSILFPCAVALCLAASTVWAAPAKPPVSSVQAILAKPVDKAVVSFKAVVLADQGKNKFLVEDAGKRMEVKAGPDWHHSVSLPLKQPLTLTGEVRVKDKDGKQEVKLELFRAVRADGAVLTVRTADDKPWEGKDKQSGKPPVRLEWKKS